MRDYTVHEHKSLLAKFHLTRADVYAHIPYVHLNIELSIYMSSCFWTTLHYGFCLVISISMVLVLTTTLL